MTDDTRPATDILVIGSGPAGYTAAIYAARAGHTVRVLAGIEQPGGALTTTTQVDNFPGFADGVQGPELMEQMAAQAARFGTDIRFEQAEQVQLLGDTKRVATYEGSYVARAVVVATGAAHKHLGVPGEDLVGVSYCATCDGIFFADKDVVVVGGGDTACEEALFLAGVAGSVTMLVRGTGMRASAAMQSRVVSDGRIAVRFDAPVSRILAGESGVVGVELSAGRVVDASGVFVAIGHVPRSELFVGQLDVDTDGYVVTSTPTAHGAVTATNVPGVFAAGDVVDRRYRQAITAAASGCQAALDAHHWLASS